MKSITYESLENNFVGYILWIYVCILCTQVTDAGHQCDDAINVTKWFLEEPSNTRWWSILSTWTFEIGQLDTWTLGDTTLAENSANCGGQFSLNLLHLKLFQTSIILSSCAQEKLRRRCFKIDLYFGQTLTVCICWLYVLHFCTTMFLAVGDIIYR